VRVFAFLVFLVCAPAAFGDSEASRLARKARRAQVKGNVSEAYLLYSRASTLEPRNRGYASKARLLGAKAAALATAHPVALPDAEPSPDVSSVFDDVGTTVFRPPPELHPRQGRFDVSLDGDYKGLFIQLSAIYGLDCVFDSDYEPGRRFHFVLTQADYRDALNSLAAATNSFVVPLSDKVFLVAKDVLEKRKDLEQAISVTVPIPQYITTQELIELAQAVRQACGVEKLAWDNKTGSIVMRDRVSRVMPAQELFLNLFAHRAQVMIDLQMIELTRSDIVNYGINLPNLFTVAFSGTTSSTSSGSSATNSYPYGSLSYILAALAGQSGTTVGQAIVRGLFPTSLSVFTISLGAANALVNFSNSLGKTILTQNLRAIDSQSATFHYGERYPILTGSFSAGTSVGSQYVPTPSFTFEDLGVSLKVTPHIHGMNAVTLDVESEFKLLSGASNNGNPIISNRKIKSMVNLNDDEWAVVAGLQQGSDANNSAGTVGISSIPLLGRIFSQHMKDKEKSEILILMRPHLLGLPPDQNVLRDVRVGTETRPYTPL
jgi:hypothetical protein